MQTLSSYVLGTWHEAQEPFATLHDPCTAEPLARISTNGIDFAAVLRFARETGGPALRALTFAERGRLLKDLSAAWHEHREELIELSVKNGGNTRGDAKFDIDGATGTLAFYAHLGKQLGDRRSLADGSGDQLGRTARFWGQHVRVPREGVAIHINAFNFPAWGMGEKMACALLAGVPVVEKPGTPTALLAWRMARIVDESGILPAGVFQFLCGSAGDMLDHVGPQDNVAFTGSAATGAKLKATPAIISSGARLNIEADSLNAAVLAPDVDRDGETYAQFLTNIITDLTQKAGQKCTAVRRILVPEGAVAQVSEDLCTDLDRIKVGDPSEKTTRMGPVTSEAQWREVRAGISRLAARAEVLRGGTDAPEGACADGWFVAPTLLVARDANDETFHGEEVFGPVATLLPYDGTPAEAARLLRLGGGSLVSSFYSDDAEWIHELVLSSAAWHGRLWIGSSRTAGQATAPGMVLPGSVHGGPGRAGAGEELGGVRGLEFYTQRTALQGFKGLIEGPYGPQGD